MQWSPGQDQALQTIARLLSSKEQQVQRLFGYAGTGKTTMAMELASSVEGEVLFGAYTGKAAHVLRQKGCSNATTIHSLIYRSKEQSRQRLRELEAAIAEIRMEIRAEIGPEDEFRPTRRLVELEAELERERTQNARPIFDLNPDSPVRSAALVVIDECSMVDGQMGEDLLSFGTPVLVLGDPAQLPPVMGGGFFTENCKPDVMLTEIHRQAADSPIIRMASIIREGGRLEPGRYGESTVHPRGSKLSPEYVMGADQIIVGKNATRHASNARARQLLGFGNDPLPQPSDRLVCLRNNHEVGLLNGALWTVDAALPTGDERIALSLTSLDDDHAPRLDCEAHTHYFLGRGDQLPWYEKREAQEFDYGYALTCHKAQGSQWPNVLVFDESYVFRADRNRWLYTAITRAADRVDVVAM